MAWYDEFDARKFFDPGGLASSATSHTPTQYQNDPKFNAYFDQGMLGLTNQSAPQMQAANMGAANMGNGASLQMGADPFRAAQLQQMGQLQGIASGQQQGAGELAAQRQVMNAQAAQQAQARMARGNNAALAYRNAANQTAALGVTGAGLGQQAAMQDQMNAHGLLGQVGAQGRQSDIGVANANAGYANNAAQQNAGFQQATNQANAGFQQQAAGQNANAQGQMQQLNNGNYLQLLQQLSQRDQNKYNADSGVGTSKDQADAAKSGGLISGIGAAFGAFSDERLKTDITDGRHEVDRMLDELLPKEYAYKDQKHGEGRRVGIMAQDLEKSEAGRKVVYELPEGKALDINKGLSAALASVARLNERVRAIEAK
jgi:hypothetical protein